MWLLDKFLSKLAISTTNFYINPSSAGELIPPIHYNTSQMRWHHPECHYYIIHSLCAPSMRTVLHSTDIRHAALLAVTPWSRLDLDLMCECPDTPTQSHTGALPSPCPQAHMHSASAIAALAGRLRRACKIGKSAWWEVALSDSICLLVAVAELNGSVAIRQVRHSLLSKARQI